MYPLVTAKEKHLSLFEAESSGLQLNHAGLGRELAESWGIPDKLIEAISNYHSPKVSSLDPELASLVHMADVCARNFGFGSGGDPYTPVLQTFAMENLGISTEDLMSWDEEMSQMMDKDMAFLAAIQ
jgi:HD-like signal output (HDOD) protein